MVLPHLPKAVVQPPACGLTDFDGGIFGHRGTLRHPAHGFHGDAALAEDGPAGAVGNHALVRQEVPLRPGSALVQSVEQCVYPGCADNNNGYAKTAREFQETLAEHLGRAYPDIITHTKRGNFCRDITLTAESREQYRRAYGYDGTEFLA